MFIFPSNELSRLCDNSSLKTKKKPEVNRLAVELHLIYLITTIIIIIIIINFNLPYLIIGQICVKLIYDSIEFFKLLFSSRRIFRF